MRSFSLTCRCLAAVSTACLCLLGVGPVCGAELRVDFGDPAAAAVAGGIPIGRPEIVDTPAGRAVRLAGGAGYRFPAAGQLDVSEGSIRMGVVLLPPADPAARRTLFHADSGEHRHLTLFIPSPGRLLFVYKGSADSWRGAVLRIDDWEPGTRRVITASWKATRDFGVVLRLQQGDAIAGVAGGVIPDPAPAAFTVGVRGTAEPANALVDEFVLSDRFAGPPPLAPDEAVVPVTVDAGRTLGPMPRPWSFVTPWNSKTNRIPFDREHPYFRRFREAGFDMVRLVAFSEEWLWGTRVERGEDGRLDLDFSDFDFLVGMYRDAGAEPYIRLAYHLPAALTDGRAGRYGSPTDMDEWRDLMRRIVGHCVDRQFGVRYYVTHLNEADIHIRRGDATWEPVLALYEETTRIVREIDPTAKVGGPATCGPLPGVQEPGLRTFLRFCRERNLPPDFICFHQYRTPHPRDYGIAVATVRQIVEEEYPGLKPEIFLDEWNLWEPGARSNNEYAAAYLASAVQHQLRAGVTRSSIVSFNSHLPLDEFAGSVWSRRGGFRKDESPVATARFHAAKADVGGIVKRSLYTHAIPGEPGPGRPYTFGRFTVPVPRGAVLRFATGIGIDYPDGDGCGMTVLVREAGAEKVAFTALVEGHAWTEREVSLEPWAGRTVEIEFRTDFGRSNAAGDHAVWGEPRIEADGAVAYDFVAQIDAAVTGYSNRIEWHETMALPMLKGPVVTPVYFTWYLLNRLRGEQLPVSLDGEGGIRHDEAVGAMACRDGEAVRVFVWHYDGSRAAVPEVPDLPGTGAERTVELAVTGLPPRVRMQRFLIDHDHSNAFTDYVLKGKDTDGGRYNLETGTVDVVEDRPVDTQNGTARVTVPLRNLSVTLLEFTPR